jgi:hypothetical protein
MKIFRLFLALSLGLVLSFRLETLFAQTYPSQPLKLVMPFVPGTAGKRPKNLCRETSERIKAIRGHRNRTRRRLHIRNRFGGKGTR